MLLLPLLFLFVLLELRLGLAVAARFGPGPTLSALLGAVVLGGAILRRRTATWSRVQAELAGGRPLGDALLAGLADLAAGVLLLFPGFLSDGLGMLLLLPPTRRLALAALRRRGERAFRAGRPSMRFSSSRGAGHDTAPDGRPILDREVIVHEPPTRESREERREEREEGEPPRPHPEGPA